MHRRRLQKNDYVTCFWVKLIIILSFNCYFINAANNHIYVFGSGVILERTDRVLLSEHKLRFNLELNYPLPTIRGNLPNSTCFASAERLDYIKTVHKRVKESIMIQFKQVMTQASTSKDIVHFVNKYIAKSLVESKSATRLVGVNDTVVSQAEMRAQRKAVRTINERLGKVVKNLSDLNKKRSEIARSRKKRAFQYLSKYWTLSGYVEDKFKGDRKWSENHFVNTNNRIDNLGVTIEKEANLINHVSHTMCMNEAEFQLNFEEAEIARTIADSIKVIASDIQLIENGFLPHAINKSFTDDFCQLHFKQSMDSEFCRIVNIRELFSSQLMSIRFDEENDGIVIKLEVSVPETDVKSHNVYRINRVPVFAKNVSQPVISAETNTIDTFEAWTLITDADYLAVSADFNADYQSAVAFRNCYNFKDHFVCQKRANILDERCLSAIFKSDQIAIDGYCNFSKRVANLDCFFKKLEHGIVVSTATEKLVHTNPRNHEQSVFNQRSKFRKGIFLIEYDLETVSSLNCGNRMIRTNVRKHIQNITISLPNVQMLTTFHVAPDFRDIQKDINRISQRMQQFNATKLNLNSTYQTPELPKGIDRVVSKIHEFGVLKSVLLVIGSIISLMVIALIACIVRIIVNQFSKCKAITTVDMNRLTPASN